METTSPVLTVGEMLKSLRVSYGVTQKRLGDCINMKDSQIRRYENGYSIPKAITLEMILKGLFTKAITQSIFPEYYFIQANDDLDTEIRFNFSKCDYNYFETNNFGIYFFDLNKNKAQYITTFNDEREFKKIFEKIDSHAKTSYFVFDFDVQKMPIVDTKKIVNDLLGYYNKLNETGVKKLLDYASDLTKIDEYTTGSGETDKKQVDTISDCLREQHENK